MPSTLQIPQARKAALDPFRTATAGLRVNRAKLLARILRFNFAIAADIHASQLPCLEIDGLKMDSLPKEAIPLFDRLRMNPRGRTRITEEINRQTQWQPLGIDAFGQLRMQVALMDPAVMHKLHQTLAAALLCEPICNEIQRTRRLELETALPQEVLAFARRRCRLTLAPAARPLASRIPDEWSGASNEWTSRVRQTCVCVRQLLWRGLEIQLQKRIYWKLPRSWTTNDNGPVWTDADGETAWGLVRRLLEADFLEDWQTCFN